jgi:glycosyltransferase involved in cell wall biosynthesis
MSSLKLLYCHDNVYFNTELGEVYSQGQFPYSYFEPFLRAFEKVTVVGRKKPLDRNLDMKKLNVSHGQGLEFELMPNINAPLDLVKNYHTVNAQLKALVAEADAVVIRAVSDLGWLTYKHAKAMNKPIAMEMCACAWDSTWNHGHKLGKLYASVRMARDKTIALNADYVLYVTKEFLQKRYKTNGLSMTASNVRLDVPRRKALQERLKKINEATQDDIAFIGIIGTVGHRLKGIHIALKALANIERREPGRFIFRVLGPGNPGKYIEMANKLGLSHCVFFDGVIQTGPKVIKWLENVDIYIQPSFQEGVPRATIEAMSVACPVVASSAGGIPELISPEWLHKPGDVKGLEEKLEKMLGNHKAQKQAAMENFERSQNYASDVLVPIREVFWKGFAAFAEQRIQKKAA